MKSTLPLLVSIFVLFCSVSVKAHRFGPDIVRECPGCKIPFRQRTMISGNTFGATVWTDGKMVARMRPDRPWFVKCPECETLFWIDTAKELGRLPRGLINPQEPPATNKWPNSVVPALPSELNYVRSAEYAVSEKKEIYLRQRAWWAANDHIRSKSTDRAAFSKDQRVSLIKLATLLDENDPDQRIIKSEIYRELGMFSLCNRQLEEPFENTNHARLAGFIRSLANSKVTAVKEIPWRSSRRQQDEDKKVSAASAPVLVAGVTAAVLATMAFFVFHKIRKRSNG